VKVNLNIQFGIGLIIAAAAASTASFFLTQIKAVGLRPVPVAVDFATFAAQIVAAAYFLWSFRNIKRPLKVAYGLLAAGIVAFTFVQVLPVVAVISQTLARTIIGSNIHIAIMEVSGPYLLGSLLIYLGIYKFARVLNVRTIWSNIWLCLALAVVAAGVIMVVPHPHTLTTRTDFNLGFAPIAASVVLAFMALTTALSIRHILGPIYKAPMVWVAIALGALTFTNIHEVIVQGYFPLTKYNLYDWSLWPFLVVGLTFLKSGISFKGAGRQYIDLSTEANYIDIVTGAAGLASKPQEIDETLNKVRAITATRTNDQLTAEDKKTLLDVYRSIEEYLTTREPLHTYTKEGLRDNLPSAFVQELG
jgi:hypothetical protein